MIERHYTTAELAELLAVHPETIRRAAAARALRSIRVGRERRYPESAVGSGSSITRRGGSVSIRRRGPRVVSGAGQRVPGADGADS